MSKKYNELEPEYDSLKDVTEFQKNMYNPGHYIGTGKVPPTVSAPGNALPLAIDCFLGAVFILTFGIILFFSDANVTWGGLIESPILNKIIMLVIMGFISFFFVLLGLGYVRKTKRYYRAKIALESEETEDETEDDGQEQIWQRKCPKCGKSHDIDYPKCPFCKFNYLQ